MGGGSGIFASRIQMILLLAISSIQTKDRQGSESTLIPAKEDPRDEANGGGACTPVGDSYMKFNVETGKNTQLIPRVIGRALPEIEFGHIGRK